jgi:acyl carrier protein
MKANPAKEEIRPENAEVHRYVRELISRVACIPSSDIDEAEFLSSYGVNSVDLIDVIVKLESRYGAQFDPETMKGLTCRSLSENVLASLAAK